MLSLYHFNPHCLPVFIAAAIVLAFGVILWSKSIDFALRNHFVVLCVGIFIWLFCTAMGYLSISSTLALKWFQADNAGVMFISPSFFSFSSELSKIRNKRLMVLGYLLASCFGVLSLLGYLPVSGVHKFWWGWFPQWYTGRSIPFFLFFFGYMSAAFVVLQKALKQSISDRQRNQIYYVLAAFGVAYFGSIDYLATFGYSVYPFGFLPIFCLVAILFYAVVKHSLMDITIIIRKTLTYSLVMGCLTVTYLAIISIFAHLFEGITGYQTVFSSAVAAGLITLGFQPLRKRIQALVDGKFFRQYVDREEKLYELSREVITHTTPEAMGDALMRVLSDTLHPKAGALYLRSKSGSGFTRYALTGSTELPTESQDDNPLVQYFQDHPQPFVQELPSTPAESQNTRNAQSRSKAA